jgi:hypothetical protein
MNVKRLVTAATVLAVTLSAVTYGVAADTSTVGSEEVKHVLLLSIDGMHAVDFYNCALGLRAQTMATPIAPIWPSWPARGSTT